MRRTPDQEARVRALAGAIVLCFWARYLTVTVPLSTQEYKWVPTNCQGNLTKCWRVTFDGLASHPGGVAIFLVASCYKNGDKLRQLCVPGSWLNLFFFVDHTDLYQGDNRSLRTLFLSSTIFESPSTSPIPIRSTSGSKTRITSPFLF